MKKNDPEIRQNFEELLKKKMAELSDSVDCFDKISARAFPEKDSDFSDCGSTVSDLENVTGKRRMRLPVLRWTAAAAALIICLSIVPVGVLFNKMKNNFASKPQKVLFKDIIRELEEETNAYDYMVYDVSLDYYIKNDLLLTPLYRCPFEKSGSNDARVKVFVKVINGVKTNQVYAVEYEGEYNDENIVAAAASKAVFTEDETEELEKDKTPFIVSETKIGDAVKADFGKAYRSGTLNHGGSTVSAASITDTEFFKDGDEIYHLVSDMIYCNKQATANLTAEYNYDICSYYCEDGKEHPYEITKNLWRRSLYRDNESAMPEEDGSVFTKTTIFGSESESSSDEEMILCYMIPFYRTPQSLYSGLSSERHENEMYSLCDPDVISTVNVPYDTSLCGTLKIWFVGNESINSGSSGDFSIISNSNINISSDESTLFAEYKGVPDTDAMTDELENIKSAVEAIENYLDEHELPEDEEKMYRLELDIAERAQYDLEYRIADCSKNETNEK